MVICIFTSLKSFSQEWKLVGTGVVGDGNRFEMYMKPVIDDVKYGVKKAWFKNVLPKILYTVDGVTYDVNGWTLSLVNARCSDRKILTTTVCYYSNDGKLVHQENTPFVISSFEDIVPDTAGEFYFGLLCE